LIITKVTNLGDFSKHILFRSIKLFLLLLMLLPSLPLIWIVGTTEPEAALPNGAAEQRQNAQKCQQHNGEANQCGMHQHQIPWERKLNN
jgi:hypothetical protein